MCRYRGQETYQEKNRNLMTQKKWMENSWRADVWGSCYTFMQNMYFCRTFLFTSGVNDICLIHLLDYFFQREISNIISIQKVHESLKTWQEEASITWIIGLFHLDKIHKNSFSKTSLMLVWFVVSGVFAVHHTYYSTLVTYISWSTDLQITDFNQLGDY